MTPLKAALLGRELSHSISNELHRELFRLIAPKLGIETDALNYEMVECQDGGLFSAWITTAGSLGYLGANVTYPYKNDLYELASVRVGAAGSIRSANTARFSGSRIECASTDGVGFLSSLLREHPQFDLEPYHLVILGDGAAAKAVTFALCTKWMPLSLTIVSRNPTTAKALAEFSVAEAAGPTVRVMSINDAVNNFPDTRHRLVVQATPVGQKNRPGNVFAGFAWNDLDMAIDLVYNPTQTTFLMDAAAARAKTMNGLGMLIEQAALSQVFWCTGMIPATSPLGNEDFVALKTRFTSRLSA